MWGGHTSYSGCLNPSASDYDCAGGSGDGPYYTGSVQVSGYDEYDLGRDGDGFACEESGETGVDDNRWMPN